MIYFTIEIKFHYLFQTQLVYLHHLLVTVYPLGTSRVWPHPTFGKLKPVQPFVCSLSVDCYMQIRLISKSQLPVCNTNTFNQSITVLNKIRQNESSSKLLKYLIYIIDKFYNKFQKHHTVQKYRTERVLL